MADSGILDNINPLNMLANGAGKVADIAANESLNNTTKQDVTATAPVLTEQQQNLVAPAQEIPQQLPATEQAIQNVGQNVAATAPAIQSAVEATQNQTQDAVANKQDLQTSINNFNQIMLNKQKYLDRATTELQQNPQAAVQKQYFGTVSHAVMSSLAMALSGIGSGLTGQANGAVQVYQTQIKNAIDQRAQNIQGYLEQAQKSQLSADSQMNKAQVAALSRNVATAEIGHIQQGVIDGMSAYSTAKSGNDTAQVLKQKAIQDTAQAGAGIAQTFMGKATSGTATNTTGLVNLLNGVHVGQKLSADSNVRDIQNQTPGSFKFYQNPGAQSTQSTQLTQSTQSTQPSQTEAPTKKSFLQKMGETLKSSFEGGY